MIEMDQIVLNNILYSVYDTSTVQKITHSKTKNRFNIWRSVLTLTHVAIYRVLFHTADIHLLILRLRADFRILIAGAALDK